MVKKRIISSGNNRITTCDRPFQSGGTVIIAVDEVSCRAIAISQEFRNLHRWSWMLQRGKKNVITIIVTAYYPKASSIIGGTYSQQLEALKIMKIQNYLRNQFLIDLNTEIAKWMDQGEQLILMGDLNSEVSEVNKRIEKNVLTNKICDIHGYSDDPITYQQSKDCLISGIYNRPPLAENQGGYYPLED